MPVTNRELISQFLEAIRKDIIAEHIAQGQRASGRTLESFEVSSGNNSGQLLAADYVGVLEDGRRSGKVPSNFAAIIQEWMKAKGILNVPNQGRIAFLIARKISQEGTKLFRSGGQSGVLSKALSPSRIDAFVGSFAEKYQEEVLSDMVEAFKR
jgi:hypothetical protein